MRKTKEFTNESLKQFLELKRLKKLLNRKESTTKDTTI